MIKHKLIKQFGNERLMLDLSAVQDEEIMRHCIEKCLKDFPIKGKKIAVESGTFHGVSASLLADYFDEVHTFDIKTGGYWKEEKIKHEIWQFLGIQDKIKPYMINNDKEKAEILKNISWDFGWIDGNHTTGTMVDFELFKKCGRILFHDYNKEKALKSKGMWWAVYNFINNLNPQVSYIKQPFALWMNKNEKM